MSAESLVSQLAVVLATIVAAVWDVRQYRVPNRLTVTLLFSGLVFHGIERGLAGVGSSFGGLLFGFAVMIVLYMMGATGAGDVKLMAGVGAWLGMPATFYVFLVAAAATAVYSVAVLLWRGGFRQVFVSFYLLLWQLMAVGRLLGNDERIEAIVRQPDRRKHLVPFAATVALGAVLVAVCTWLALP